MIGNAVFGGDDKSDAIPEVAAPVSGTDVPVAAAPVDTAPVAAPVVDSAPEPVTDFSATAQAPAVETPLATPTPSSDAISFDSMPPQTPVSSTPASIPADNVRTTTPIDSPLIDPSAPNTGSQAIAPDAVTPDQAGPSADPFAIPSEPLDLPEDNQVQAAPPQGQAQ